VARDKTPIPITVRSDQAPIVRVSLDRLDDLIELSVNLASNRSLLVRELAKLEGASDQNDLDSIFESLAGLFDLQRNLNNELQDRLFRIRMVRFGTLETRLSRAVNVTCQEENKKAQVTIINSDCEVDTQIIDALIEPLLHLLKNAVVHGIEREETRRLIGKPEKGSIRIRVESDDNGVTLTIEDDGRGISAGKLKEKAVQNGLITEAEAAEMNDDDSFALMFKRGLTTADTLNLNAGRGVGMSIVKESIEKCRGRILVASEPQIGTKFTIKMPLVLSKAMAKTPEVDQTAIDTDSVNESRRLVMIVDDSASVRRHACKLVENAGHQVITAQNGAEALELLLSDAWRPDIILSDIEMPIMDGWDLLEYVKTDSNFGHIPIVMITSLNSDQHRRRAAELGASDYYVKPFDEAGLISVLNEYLGARQP